MWKNSFSLVNIQDYAKTTALNAIVASRKNINKITSKQSHKQLTRYAHDTPEESQVANKKAAYHVTDYFWKAVEEIKTNVTDVISATPRALIMMMGERVFINSQDAKLCPDIDEAIQYIKTNFGDEQSGVKTVYLTPSVAMSDNADRKADSHPKHPSSVAYLVTPQVSLDKLFHSDDLFSAVSIFNIHSFGKEIDELIQQDFLTAAIKIRNHVEAKTLELYEAISTFIPSYTGGQLHPLFVHYGAQASDILPAGSETVTLGEKNGFIGLYHSTEIRDGKSIPIVQLVVRSYDTQSAREVFSEIHSRKMTLEQVLSDRGMQRSMNDANRLSEINRGYIAFSLIHQVLGWKTEHIPNVVEFRGQELKSLKPSEELHYNSLTAEEDGTFIYRDHCFNVKEMVDSGGLTLLKGRYEGIVKIVGHHDLFSESRWDERLWSLPMGSRKKKLSYGEYVEHSRKKDDKLFMETLQHYKNPNTAPKGHVLWSYGHGRVHIKSHPQHYESTSEFLTQLRRIYKIQTLSNVQDTIHLKPYFCAIGQFFPLPVQEKIPVSIRLLLLDDEQPLMLRSTDPFLKKHFFDILNGMEDGSDFKDLVPLYNKNSRVFVLDKNRVARYLKLEIQ